MTSNDNSVFRLEDYAPTDYAISTTELTFSLHPTQTIVKSKLSLSRRDKTKPASPLVLVGDELKLLSVAINGNKLSQSEFFVSPEKLEIYNPPKDNFVVEIVTEINPKKNRQLMGLYLSNGVYCTQNEPEGFRRITYFYDRPDVLSVFTTRIEADETTEPILLANGNLVESGKLEGGRHYAVWHDPHPKPCYLFALVGGTLDHLNDSFTTMSGRKVKLGIYVEKGKKERAAYAMDSLKRAMRWDEQRFGREYDLDIFNIVAVSDFNMGAMENKGLNIFNDKYVLADKSTATDFDYAGIERVIAHEYFHNWTGDRITCRDWFQLCLKEGLTVYRDQEFSSDQRSRPVHRISDVRVLKVAQFPEDAGPLAHPVRPRQYREINNFYTTTVYEKGAEVVRMVHTLLGEQLFRKGMDLYFERHDGEACTIEDFIACFADVSGRDFSQFMLWYEQAGTPTVTVNSHYKDGVLTLDLEQTLPDTPGQSDKKPMIIPLSFGLLGKNGKDMPYQADNHVENNVIVLNEKKQTVHLRNLSEKPVLSLLRGFSAPVNLKMDESADDIAFRANYDTDEVNRWQSLNQLISQALINAIKDEKTAKPAMPEKLQKLIEAVVDDETLEPAFRSLCLQLPSEVELARMIGQDIDPDRIFAVRQSFIVSLAAHLKPLLLTVFDKMATSGHYSPAAEQAGKRALKNTVLDYLSLAENSPERAFNAFSHADNMTDRMAGLAILVHHFDQSDEAQEALADFEKRYGHDPLVMDKWFTVQATVPGSKTLDHVKELMKHPLFSLDNPNRTRALIAAFAASNQTGFNRRDGQGYKFLADIILTVDKENPQLAARLLTTTRSWRQLEQNRRAKLYNELQRIADTANLSVDVSDIVQRTLG
ncbi:aminopeptidase N [uncultured Bartonella sp.]|uniref:aminopeptidase N n=1 Tax=uncultured Bartonella sp. TaxID=104108 RepID=UPI002613032B|nr:aminopeptidase N [uncultured Bartonella sp.]